MRVILLDAGERRINVIREIRAFTGATLKDAKDLSEKRNVAVFDGHGKVGRRFAAALRDQGASVETSTGARLSLANMLRAIADWIEG